MANNSNDSLANNLKKLMEAAGVWGLVAGAGGTGMDKTKESISELKELDSLLTEISKTSALTASELKELGMSAYDVAGKYGKSAKEYLTAVKEMAQFGFHGKQGAKIAEQSLLAQTAGGMDQELADSYILATNAAFKFNGAAEKINDVLDGQNNIASRNNIALADMAEAMEKASEAASGYGVSVEDLSAMIGTIESATGSSGSETGSGIKAILSNLQDMASSEISNTLDTAGASMTEISNGSEKLRNPIEILRDLADTFHQLDENDPLRADILADIGGSGHEAHLAALLENMDMFDRMLADYSGGSGSAMEKANKSAHDLTGSLNTLSNSWTKLVNSMINTDQLTTGANALNNIVQTATKLVSVLSPTGALGLGAGLFAGIKNVGGDKMHSPVCFEYADNNMCSLGY